MYVPCLGNSSDSKCLNKTLDETREYLGAPGIYMIRNQKRFDTRSFAKGVIVEESMAYWASFDTSIPTLTQGTIRL